MHIPARRMVIAFVTVCAAVAQTATAADEIPVPVHSPVIRANRCSVQDRRKAVGYILASY
jgi:hypothetical protein